MTKLPLLQSRTLSRHLATVHIIDRPRQGWICATRQALGMSARQLAARLHIAQQSVSNLEKNESTDTITLNSLRKVAEAMDCKLVYALVPKAGNLEDIIKHRAHQKAKQLVDAVDHSMMLEDQRVGDKQKTIRETAARLSQTPNPALWD